MRENKNDQSYDQISKKQILSMKNMELYEFGKIFGPGNEILRPA